MLRYRQGGADGSGADAGAYRGNECYRAARPAADKYRAVRYRRGNVGRSGITRRQRGSLRNGYGGGRRSHRGAYETPAGGFSDRGADKILHRGTDNLHQHTARGAYHNRQGAYRAALALGGSACGNHCRGNTQGKPCSAPGGISGGRRQQAQGSFREAG